MGIKTTRTLPTGYSADYGRILSLDCLHVDGQRIDAVIGWYKDETARRDGAQPADGERVSVQLTAKEVDALIKVVYESEGFRALNPEAEAVIEKKLEE
jgi:hypothetical protein